MTAVETVNQGGSSTVTLEGLCAGLFNEASVLLNAYQRGEISRPDLRQDMETTLSLFTCFCPKNAPSICRYFWRQVHEYEAEVAALTNGSEQNSGSFWFRLRSLINGN